MQSRNVRRYHTVTFFLFFLPGLGDVPAFEALSCEAVLLGELFSCEAVLLRELFSCEDKSAEQSAWSDGRASFEEEAGVSEGGEPVKVRMNFNQWYGSGMFMPDPDFSHPGYRI